MFPVEGRWFVPVVYRYTFITVHEYTLSLEDVDLCQYTVTLRNTLKRTNLRRLDGGL